MTDSFSTSPDPPRAAPCGRAAGRLTVPPSKSVTNRYLVLALLAGRPCTLRRPLLAEDTRHLLAALAACGFGVAERPGRVELTPGPPPAAARVDCGASGTMLRLLTAALAAVPGHWTLDGVPRLRQRPVGPLLAALRQLGTRLRCLGEEGFAPLEIDGGSLGAGRAVLDAGESSQFLSALLLAALRAPGEVTVEVTALTSGPYVDLTLEAAAAFGGRIVERRPVERRGVEPRGERQGEKVFRVHPGSLEGGTLTVEGDDSAACYPAAAAALSGGRVVLDGLSPTSSQGDRGFFALLEEMGARVAWHGDEVEIEGGALRGVEADLSAMPDQVPTLAALAPFAAGETRIVNVPHLRLKESDRLAAMARELRRAGVPAVERPAGLTIPGVWAEASPPSEPVVLASHGDHRIAMACALLGLRRPGISVAEPGVVAKSYPDFWEDWETLTQGALQQQEMQQQEVRPTS